MNTDGAPPLSRKLTALVSRKDHRLVVAAARMRKMLVADFVRETATMAAIETLKKPELDPFERREVETHGPPLLRR
jgi:uncharacterized protein (DUF1778 family)